MNVDNIFPLMQHALYLSITKYKIYATTPKLKIFLTSKLGNLKCIGESRDEWDTFNKKYFL